MSRALRVITKTIFLTYQMLGMVAFFVSGQEDSDLSIRAPLAPARGARHTARRGALFKGLSDGLFQNDLRMVSGRALG